MKTKKFKEFVNEVGLDLVKYNQEKEMKKNDLIKFNRINENKSSEELKKAAETIGLDLTKNLSDIIYLI